MMIAVVVATWCCWWMSDEVDAQECDGQVTISQTGAQVFGNPCRGTERNGVAPTNPVSTNAGGPAVPAPPMAHKVVVVQGPDGPCVAAIPFAPIPLSPGGPTAPPTSGLNDPLLASTLERYLDEGYAPCAGSALPVVTPRLWAESWFREQVFPVPEPRIGVGRFVVGLEAFLETGATLSVSRTDASPFGPAALSLRSDVVVDWGDGRGEDEGPFESAGGPYPDGDIRHVYQRSGFYDVVLTQRWTLVPPLTG